MKLNKEKKMDTLNYKILSEKIFKHDSNDTYQFEIEINESRLLAETKNFTIAFQKNKSGVWCSASQFDYDADESQQLILLGGEMAQSLADPEIIEYYQLSNTGLKGDEFVVTNLLYLELEEYEEIVNLLNSGFAIIDELRDSIKKLTINRG